MDLDLDLVMPLNPDILNSPSKSDMAFLKKEIQ